MTGRAKKRGWVRITLSPSEAAPLFRDKGFVGCPDAPERCHGSMDRQGRPRRMHAVYPNGWRATLVFHLDGSVSLSQTWKARIPGGTTA